MTCAYLTAAIVVAIRKAPTANICYTNTSVCIELALVPCTIQSTKSLIGINTSCWLRAGAGIVGSLAAVCSIAITVGVPWCTGGYAAGPQAIGTRGTGGRGDVCSCCAVVATSAAVVGIFVEVHLHG
jgi:hypothetical protein